MKQLVCGIMVIFVFVARLHAQESSAFDLGYHVREGQVLVDKSAIMLKTVPQTITALTGPAAPKAAPLHLAGLEALVGIERLGVDAQADKIEREARELSENGSITTAEFERCLEMVKTLRKTHDDLDRIWRELDGVKVNTTR